MLEIFTHLADWLVYGLAGLDSRTLAGAALHLYAEDATGILAPPVVLVQHQAAGVAWLRTAAPLRVRRRPAMTDNPMEDRR